MRQALLASIVLTALVSASHAGAAPGPLSLVASFNPAAFELPESVTVDHDGTFYMSMGPTVQRLPEGGSLELYSAPPLPPGAFVGGVKIGPDGDVYAVSGGFSPSPSAAFVWHIDGDGVTHEVAALDPSGFPDDLTFDDDGNIYVSDAFLGLIWKIDASGDASVWVSDPLLLGNPSAPAVVISPFGAVGLAFDKKKENLYVANLDYGTILKIAVGPDGEAGVPEIFAEDPELIGADGIAFDRKGTLYAGVHTQDQVAAIAPDGSVSIIAQGGVLDAPASLVFGKKGSGKDTLYITNFAINRFLGTQPGAPHPGLLALPVGTNGLPIP